MSAQGRPGNGGRDRPWVLLGVAVLGLLALAPGPRHLLTLFESRFTDLLFVSVQRPASEHPVAVVAKDQLFIDQFGREPGRGDMARALDAVAGAGGQV
ncbi:MAG TPA: hypothetical protein VIV61_16280, partial [Candidatus Ozemobacteraceae bacterium]